MRKLTSCISFILPVFVIAMITACSNVQEYNGPAADLVIKNAKIVTIDKDNPRAEAIAVTGEVIVGVGSNNYIEQFIDESKTAVIDAEGRLVVPGFNDAHAHFGGIDPNEIDLRYITDPGIITESVREKVAQARPGELISGGGWDHEMFSDKKWPTKELIDPASPDNPVILDRVGGHNTLVNSYILRASGIAKDTPDPFGGEIQRDPVTGEATGILKETARRLIRTGVKEITRTPEEEREQQIREWQAAFDLAASVGVTSIQLPPGDGPEMYQLFKDMGKLTLRVYFGASLPGDSESLNQIKELEAQYPRDGNWIRFGYLKGLIDGNLGGGTALLYEPFEDEPDKIGLPRYTYEELERRIVAADKMGFQIGIHAIGTKGSTWVLDAFEKAQQVNGKRDSRHRNEHAQVLIPEDIPRFAQLGVIASMQPVHCITDKRFCEKRIGYERSKGAYAWRSLLDTGAQIAFGTDYTVEPLDPLEGLYAAVTRKDRFNRDEPSWFPEQCLTMEESIELYTLGSAYAEFMEGRKGMLKVNYLADLVIYKEDLMTMPAKSIMDNKVDYTIAGGKIVYQRLK
ncbi:amidohydrolase [candidate division KSB1 bacterium]